MQVLRPTGRLRNPQSDCAPRPKSLDGLEIHTIALNFKNVPPFLDRILERIQQDFAVGRVEQHPKIKFTEGFPEDGLADIAERADVVISAFGH